MATTNYDDPRSRSSVSDSLHNSTLPSFIADKIIKLLPGRVDVGEFDAAPTGSDVHGNDLVLINTGGIVNLAGILKADIKDVDAFVFTTNDPVTFTLGSDHNILSFKGVVSTNAGDDIININSKSEVTVSSGDGNDSVTTGSGNDSVNAGAGNDTVNTGGGKDTVSAGSGNDSVNTGAGNDSVSAGSGNDTVSTGDGNDTVTTGAGDDSIETGSGNDSVLVGSGNDTVNTGSGNDTVKLDFAFEGTTAHFNGGAGTSDKLDLRLVNIDTVDKVGATITITLDDGSVITADNFEKFVYDSNGLGTDGGVKTVGVNDFLGHDFSG